MTEIQERYKKMLTQIENVLNTKPEDYTKEGLQEMETLINSLDEVVTKLEEEYKR